MKINNKKYIILFLIVSILINSCTNYEYGTNLEENNSQYQEKNNLNSGEVINEIENNQNDLITTEGENEELEVIKNEEQETKKDNNLEKENLIVAYEGDLVDLKPYVLDPDGDDIKLTYTFPFDEKGTWQTKKGDAGFYSVIVTATDNKNSLVMKEYAINVLIKNKLPVIQIKDVLEFNEGDLIILEPAVTDEDDNEIFVTYSGWMTSKMYKTNYNDSGTHEVIIRADDGKDYVEKNVTIVVNDVNREPVIELEQDQYEITEGDKLKVKASVYDPDDDKVEFKFGKPLSESGVWETKKGDAGKYIAKVTASDGINTVTKEIEINILKKNEPPVINSISAIPDFVELKQPGDTAEIKIKVEASDPDNDELTITYSGDMESNEKVFRYGEKGGIKKVLVTVSDGKENVSKEITFKVNNWPCFDCQNLIK